MSITTLGQETIKLKSGVYEFMKKNTAAEWDSIMKRTDSVLGNPSKLLPDVSIGEFFTQRKLILKNNADTIVACYFINSYNSMGAGVGGLREMYILNPKKNKNNMYKTKTSQIELDIHIISKNKIEVEVFNGTIKKYISGGQYFEQTIPLLPEKYILNFVRALTAKDEKELK